MRTRMSVRALATAVTALCVLATAPVAAQDNTCRPKVEKLAADHDVALGTILSRLSEDKQTKVLGWAGCASSHMSLDIVVEQAIRALDAQNTTQDGGLRLFISPGQSVTVHDPESAFARSEVIAKINNIAEARTHAANLLGPKGGAGTWRSVLTDLNAETHALKALLALEKAKLLGDAPTADATELATVMLIAAAYVSHAQSRYPEVFNKMAASAESVDAFRLMWTRGQTALLTARSGRLGARINPILKAVGEHVPAMNALFDKVPGVEAPDFNTEPPPVADNKPADIPPAADKKPDNPPVADNKPVDPPPAADKKPVEEKKPDNPPVADNKPADIPPAADKKPADPPPADKKPAEKAPADKKPAEIAKNAGAPKPADKAAEKPADKAAPKTEGTDKAADAEGMSTANQARLIVAGVLLLLPWLLLGLLALFKRRKANTYIQLANRTVAISVLLVFFETLALIALVLLGDPAMIFSIDGLYLLFPPYFMGVTIVMLGKLDTEGKLASRQLLQKWSKWIGLAIALIVLVNVVLVLTVFILTPHFVMIPSLLVLAAIASVFLIRLWRTGDNPDASSKKEGDEGDKDGDTTDEGPTETGDDAPAPVPKLAPKASEPKPEPLPTPEPVEAEVAEPPAAPEVKADDDNAATQMSDEALAAALEALDGDGGASSSSEESALSDEDRDELYRLLDGD